MDKSQRSRSATSDVTALVARRRALRASEDWAAADVLRREINALGYSIKDDGLETVIAPFDVVEAEKRQRGAESQQSQRALQILRSARGADATLLAEVAAAGDPTALARVLQQIPRCRTKRNRRTRQHMKEQKKRSAAFAQWLFATFERELAGSAAADGDSNAEAGAELSSSSRPSVQNQPRIVDVAGGSGGLCWELAVTHGARCTVVDPQPLRFGPAKTGALIRRARSEEDEPQPPHCAKRAKLDAAGSASSTASASASTAASASSASSPVSPVELTWLDSKARGKLDAATLRGIATLLRTRLGVTQLPILFDATFVRRPQWHVAHLITGLHPDQATDFIVDAALATGKPFAVVPCCVYPTLFAQRRLRGGSEVRSLEQLCRYLCEKTVPARFGGTIQLETVDAIPPPCNHVVWWRPNHPGPCGGSSRPDPALEGADGKGAAAPLERV